MIHKLLCPICKTKNYNFSAICKKCTHKLADKYKIYKKKPSIKSKKGFDYMRCLLFLSADDKSKEIIKIQKEIEELKKGTSSGIVSELIKMQLKKICN
jgi:hypothetical protein